MILKIMKTNLKIVKNKNKIFFKCKCKKKLEYVERFKTTLSTLKSQKKCQNCETKTKTATAHTQISRTLEDFKKHWWVARLAVIAFGMAYVFFGIQDAYLRTLQQS